MEERLQKILARAGFASRRGAEQLILEGRVTRNGAAVRELGSKADLANDDIRVDGVRVKPPRGHVYLALNKPRGVVSTRSDPERRQTVMDLVPNVAGLFPIGRLDVTTEGLILLTNDGAFAERVAHPRYEVPRVYHAKVHRVPDETALGRLRGGVRVDGELMAVDRARLIESGGNAWVELTLHEGKHHEVKRLLEAVGHPVSKLRRVAIGPVTSRGLAPGQFRTLTQEEIDGLKRGQAAGSGPLGRLARRRPRPKRRARPELPARTASAAGSQGMSREPGRAGTRPPAAGRSAPGRSAPGRSAPGRSAPRRSAPRRSGPPRGGRR